MSEPPPCSRPGRPPARGWIPLRAAAGDGGGRRTLAGSAVGEGACHRSPTRATSPRSVGEACMEGDPGPPGHRLVVLK